MIWEDLILSFKIQMAYSLLEKIQQCTNSPYSCHPQCPMYKNQKGVEGRGETRKTI